MEEQQNTKLTINHQKTKSRGAFNELKLLTTTYVTNLCVEILDNICECEKGRKIPTNQPEINQSVINNTLPMITLSSDEHYEITGKIIPEKDMQTILSQKEIGTGYIDDINVNISHSNLGNTEMRLRSKNPNRIREIISSHDKKDHMAYTKQYTPDIEKHPSIKETTELNLSEFENDSLTNYIPANTQLDTGDITESTNNTPIKPHLPGVKKKISKKK